jgi:dolichol-phosphate mannosyltransferase
MLNKLSMEDLRTTVLHLSRNFGHQAAVSAGLRYASGDAVVILDADMQDPPAVALEMIELWKGGADIVFAIRAARKEGLLKRAAYSLFYRIMKSLASIEIPLDSGDFGLIDRKALNAMLALPEKNRFVRGLRAWVGFNQTVVARDYKRNNGVTRTHNNSSN